MDDVGGVVALQAGVEFLDGALARVVLLDLLPHAVGPAGALVAVEDGEWRDFLLDGRAALVEGKVFLCMSGAGGHRAEDIGELGGDVVVEPALGITLVDLADGGAGKGVANLRQHVASIEAGVQHPGEVIHARDAHVEAVDLRFILADQLEVALLLRGHVVRVAERDALHAGVAHEADAHGGGGVDVVDHPGLRADLLDRVGDLENGGKLAHGMKDPAGPMVSPEQERMPYLAPTSHSMRR